MSLGPIPWTAINDYVNRYGFALDIAESFIEIIWEMDRIYMEDFDNKQKTKQEADKRASKRAFVGRQKR